MYMSIRSVYNNYQFFTSLSPLSWILSFLWLGCFYSPNLTHLPQEPKEIINNVKELLALQADHQGRPYQPDGSLNQKSAHDQLAESQKAFETDCNTLNLEDEDYDHLNYTRTVNELSPNYIKLNNEKWKHGLLFFMSFLSSLQGQGHIMMLVLTSTAVWERFQRYGKN